MNRGMDVILDIEVQGAIQVTSKRPDVVRIFICTSQLGGAGAPPEGAGNRLG